MSIIRHTRGVPVAANFTDMMDGEQADICIDDETGISYMWKRTA